MGNALIRIRPFDLGETMLKRENIQAARFNRKAAEAKAAAGERFQAEGKNLMAGDAGAMKRMAIIDPDMGAKLVDVFGKMDKNQREEADRQIEQAGRMWQWVLQATDPADQAARYSRVRAAMPNLNLPEQFDPNTARMGLAEAVELKTMIDQQNALARQDNQARNAMAVDNNQNRNALTQIDRRGEIETGQIRERGNVQGRLDAARDARGLQNDLVLEALRSQDRRAIAQMETEGRVAVAKAKEAGSGPGGIKTSDANSIRSAVAMAHSGMYDPQSGEFKFADPQSAANAVRLAAEAERIFADAARTGRPIGPAEAVQAALGRAGPGGPGGPMAPAAGGPGGPAGPGGNFNPADPLGLR